MFYTRFQKIYLKTLQKLDDYNFPFTFIFFEYLTVGDFCGRWTSCKFEEGTTSQLLVLLSAMVCPCIIYQ